MSDAYDTIMNLDGALIQHGTGNDRMYLMDLGKADAGSLVPKIVDLAEQNQYGKIFAKIPETVVDPFLEADFVIEARAERFFGGAEAGLFLGKYLDSSRNDEPLREQYEKVLNTAFAKQSFKPVKTSGKKALRLCTPADAPTMAELYKQVFASYPFPIDDPDFIVASMADDTIYACIEEAGELVALASAECSFKAGHLYAEMTDFATLKHKRGNGYALSLLAFLERTVQAKGIKTVYTIARAASAGMNVTFAKSGYEFGGRLHNNTNIAGKIESMNVWYK
jgi:beta-lysine N6-acetyltransferase